MSTDSFKKYLESISNKKIRTAVTSLYESTHSHRDRTTGGNWFGKTIRDQNNERDEGGEREPAEFDREEALKDDESWANMRRHDQLDNSVSAWNDKLSTSKYDYDDTMRDGFARLFADNMSDNPTFGSNKPGVWNAHFNNGLKLFDRNKEFVTSDEGRELQSSNFEYKYNHPETEPTSDDPKKMLSTDDEDVDKWIRAGYQSGDMFGEAIDKIAKVTGQKAICEAVKELYIICNKNTGQ